MENETILDLVLNTSGASGFDANAGDFDILREAVLAANLAGALGDTEADLSVFAPTDGAFIQLARDFGADIQDGDEAGALNAIIAAANGLAGSEEAGLQLITDILLYHVSPGAKNLATLQSGGDIATLNGATLTVEGLTVLDLEPDLADPMIVLQDVATGNGVVQAIDRVLLPLDVPGNETIVSVAANDDRFDILVKAVVAAGLADTLAEGSDLTVFAPTDAAFAALAHDFGYTGAPNDDDAVFAFLVEALTELGGGDPIPTLTNILLYHVSPGAKTAAEVDALDLVPNLLEADLGSEGSELTDIATKFANANIVLEDVPAGDNLIQAIDRVMLPIDLPGPVPVRGTQGADEMVGDAGDDKLLGLAGADSLDGGDGNDLLQGARGRDELSGGGGDDRLAGGKGRDVLDGGDGNDVLRGGNGADHLDGGDGDDRMLGGRGRDTLEGGAGDDILNGGGGADVFDFTDLEGADRVRDFTNRDLAIFDEDDFSGFDAFADAAEQVGRKVVVTLDDGASVTMQNTRLDDLHEGLFIFV